MYADYLMTCLCVLVTGFILFALYLLALVGYSATVNTRRNVAKLDAPPEETTAPLGWQMEPLRPPMSSENGIPQQRGFPPVSP